MSTYVLVHGAWHSGDLFENTAEVIRNSGHEVLLPTLAGNIERGDKDVGLNDAIQSAIDFIEESMADNFILLGHSYGGMIITGVADRLRDKVRRLIYWNAFVPNDGECLTDMIPADTVELFNTLLDDDGSLSLPFPIWREAFINDATRELAEAAYAKLNPHPFKTFTDRIKLVTNPAEMSIPKSYLNCTEDTALPQSLGWHPRLSEKLGLFRLVQCPGSHELCFSDPDLLAEKILQAGRD